MMLVLESSADPTVIGLIREETVGLTLIFEQVFQSRDRFADEIESLFRATGVSPREVLQIAIGIGPGSFTGLRVSLAYAKGFARGLDIPIWPVSSLKIIAANLRDQAPAIAVVSFARRGQLHFGLFEGHTLAELRPATVVDFEKVADLLAPNVKLAGPGIAKLPPEIRIELCSVIPESAEIHRPHALLLAELARTEWQHREPPAISDLLPLYGIDFPPPASR